MAIPSSPPILPTELTLPSSPLLPPLPSINSRKRRMSDHDSLSSDPLFSEEASEAELLSGDSQKQRKKIRGPWWALTHQLQRRDSEASIAIDHSKRRLRVNDSGVWLHSDSDLSDKASSSFTSDVESPPLQAKPRSRIPARTSIPETVSQRIQAALEQGYESVDLDSIGLDRITSDMIRPLHQMIRHPPEHGEYRALTPHIELYLASNKLETLPTELFRLTHLSVLSLRNNRLKTLSPAVAKLRNLRELNVAGNELKYLPWEFLSMLQSVDQIIYRPNPLYTIPTALRDDIHARYTSIYHAALRKKQTSSLYSYLASSKIVLYSNAAKRITHVSHIPDHSMILHAEVCSVSHESVPSLFEYALRRAQKENALGDAVAVLPQFVPPGLVNALETAALTREFGGDQCSVCGREMIVPRAEWIEYWSKTTMDEETLFDDALLPLMRRACTMACAMPTADGTFFEHRSS